MRTLAAKTEFAMFWVAGQVVARVAMTLGERRRPPFATDPASHPDFEIIFRIEAHSNRG
jgi:hypothetical protein